MASDDPNAREPRVDGRFLRRTLTVVGLVALLLSIALLVWNAADMFLLAFVGILIGTLLNTPARFLSERTPLPHGLALALVLLVLLGLGTGAAFLAGPSVSEQASRLIERLPDSMQQLQEGVAGLPGGEWFLDRVNAEGDGPFAGDDGIISRITGTASMFWDAMAHVIFVVILALYLAANPRTYRDGLSLLVPPKHRDRAIEILNQIGRVLQGWLLGQLMSMLFVGVSVYIGLSLLGIPLALILALIAGLFDFVPIVGPFAAFVPAVLLALTEGVTQALWVALLYLVIQQIESHVVVPLAQRSTVDLPPVLTVSAIFVGGAAFGPVGLLVATPLAAVVLVLVDMVYRHDILGEHVELPAGGEE